MSKARIDLSRYKRSHGDKQPRGRAGWLFEDRDRNILFSISGTYTEAKKKAVAMAPENSVIFLCP